MPQAEYNANPRIITENAIIIVIPCPITHMIFKGTLNDSHTDGKLSNA